MINKLQEVDRQIKLYNEIALLSKSKELEFIHKTLEEIITLYKTKGYKGITKADRYSTQSKLKIILQRLDLFILQDMEDYIDVCNRCGVDGSVIFNNYIFKNQIIDIYEVCKEFDIEYEPKVFMLEEKFNLKQELVF